MARLSTPACRGLLSAAFALSLLAFSGRSDAATITIVNLDGPGEGFNDPTPVAPVGGNPGATRGAQRLNVFQRAAAIWGAILPSAVEIRVEAQFNPMTPCDATGGVLGSAGALTFHERFPGAVFSNTWYPQALANKLRGVDNHPSNDIQAFFNSDVDNSTCLGGVDWYYGLDGNEGSDVELLPVVLHELGHGLGFQTIVDKTTGQLQSGLPDIYSRFILDTSTGLHWHEMTNAGRAASAVNTGNVVWDGAATTAAADTVLGPRPIVRVNGPPSIAGDLRFGTAAFGPALSSPGVTADVVLVNDGVGPTTDACQAILNGAQVSGKIALIDRGSCSFVSKAQAAQAVGAAAVIIANNVAGGPPAMGGSDPGITIPVVSVSLDDGNAIKANLPGVNMTVGADPVLLAGADDNGRLLLYAPNPLEAGSSISHWDVSASPNLLMEPAISGNLSEDVDLTHAHFEDIGWSPNPPTATLVSLLQAEAMAEGIEVRWRFAEPETFVSIRLERRDSPSGPWMPIVTEQRLEGSVTVALDRSAEPGRTYSYRLVATPRVGEPVTFGPITATAGAKIEAFEIASIAPNPTRGETRIEFTVARTAALRLSVLDVQGREVAILADGVHRAGRYQAVWSGQLRDRNVPAGIYFVRYRAAGEVRVESVVVMR